MNKIERELITKGWTRTRIDKNMSCTLWPDKHVRVTMWDSGQPTNFSPETGEAIGFEYADGDGATVAIAFENLKRNIDRGHCKYFPRSYANNVEKHYKEWKASTKTKKKAIKKTKSK